MGHSHLRAGGAERAAEGKPPGPAYHLSGGLPGLGQHTQIPSGSRRQTPFFRLRMASARAGSIPGSDSRAAGSQRSPAAGCGDFDWGFAPAVPSISDRLQRSSPFSRSMALEIVRPSRSRFPSGTRVPSSRLPRSPLSHTFLIPLSQAGQSA